MNNLSRYVQVCWPPQPHARIDHGKKKSVGVTLLLFEEAQLGPTPIQYNQILETPMYHVTDRMLLIRGSYPSAEITIWTIIAIAQIWQLLATESRDKITKSRGQLLNKQQLETPLLLEKSRNGKTADILICQVKGYRQTKFWPKNLKFQYMDGFYYIFL